MNEQRISDEKLSRIIATGEECAKDGCAPSPLDLLALDLRDSRAECAELAKANGLALARLAEVERERDEARHALAVRAEHAVGLLASIASMSAEIADLRAALAHPACAAVAQEDTE